MYAIDVDWQALVVDGVFASTITHTPADVFWNLPEPLYKLAMKEVEKIAKAKYPKDKKHGSR